MGHRQHLHTRNSHWHMTMLKRNTRNANPATSLLAQCTNNQGGLGVVGARLERLFVLAYTR
eukprot:874338-Lingulodinium_polyedra.AAC.1